MQAQIFPIPLCEIAQAQFDWIDGICEQQFTNPVTDSQFIKV